MACVANCLEMGFSTASSPCPQGTIVLDLTVINFHVACLLGFSFRTGRVYRRVTEGAEIFASALSSAFPQGVE